MQLETGIAAEAAVPEELARYYASFDAGRFADAVSCFSPDVLYAVPATVAGETEARVESFGRGALLARFERRGRKPYRHELVFGLRQGASCLAEGVIRPDGAEEPDASFVASAQLADDGTIERYLAYVTRPAVELAPPAGASPSADALDVLQHYFDQLEAGDFEAAAGCFSHEVVYSHPPYRHTDNEGEHRVEFRGRDELIAGFRARGRRSFRHRLVAVLQHGNTCLLEGVVDGLPGGATGSFISSLALDEDGRIRRYLSFYCEPSVARRDRVAER